MEYTVQWINICLDSAENAQVPLLRGRGVLQCLMHWIMWIMPSPSRNEFEGILGLMVDDMFKDMAAASPISVAEPIMVHHKG